MTQLRVPGAWRARLQALVQQPPLRPRAPLAWDSHVIGSVEAGFFERAGLADSGVVQGGGAGWQVQGSDLCESLAQLALALRERGLLHVWRDELLAVRAADGALLGSIERGAVRPLGIPTHAVHLCGVDAAGRHWVQQRALTKPNDPGLWDTLVGGMVPASDSLHAALERETWEEAGLRIGQVQALRGGGRVLTRRPSREVPHGYVVEVLDWFTCIVPPGVEPANQDGEVDRFELLEPAELSRRLADNAFTLDAAAILLDAFGVPA